jgi:hypothetical protein
MASGSTHLTAASHKTLVLRHKASRAGSADGIQSRGGIVIQGSGLPERGMYAWKEMGWQGRDRGGGPAASSVQALREDDLSRSPGIGGVSRYC